ncbi:MAG: hypothetical protein WCF90_05575 [Methanomicrobiales archaeon]
MIVPVARRNQVFWLIIGGISILISIFATIYSLTYGIIEVFPFHYFLQIILFVYFFQPRGIIFALVISTVFLRMIYYSSNFDPNLVNVSTAWS